MRTLLLTLLAACGAAPSSTSTQATAPPAAAQAAWDTHGAAVTRTDVVTAAALLDTPNAYADAEVLVEGTVADVCQKAGCWMVLADGQRTMRVMMKDHAFSVPKDCSGDTVRVQGVVRSRAVDPSTVEHLAGESKHPEVMPEHGRTVVWELEASSVQTPRKG